MDKIYELIILGSGPAGLGAAIYAQRAELDTLVIEKELVSGGQVLTTSEVDNYAGLPGIGGFELGMKFREHADQLGAQFAEDTILKIERADSSQADLFNAADTGNGIWKLIGENDVYFTRTIIIAAGAGHRKLGVFGEEDLAGAGVSYCATCDGAFFRGKTTAVIGGGDAALEDAVLLAKLCKKVYLIHRRNELRGAKSLQERLRSLENVEILWDTVVDSVNGDVRVETLTLADVSSGVKRELPVDGVFIAAGITPNTDGLGLEELLKLDQSGYIVSGEDGRTSCPGIFAAGDIRTKKLRQIITAVADGANCVSSVEGYLNGR